MSDAHSKVALEIDELVDLYRARCLWFLRPDYYPRSDEERLGALRYIERHGDLPAYRRAAVLRQWLSRSSSAASAAS